jgi:type II secretory pathway pseudopilin PulG
MIKRTLSSDAGFTYVAALVMVVVMGIMMGKAAVVWSTQMRRAREVELIFRGSQIRDAMQRWYYGKTATQQPAVNQTVNQTAPLPLMDLKDLLKSPNMSQTVRYLRPSMLIDPITGKDWGVIKDGAKIVGVKSTSEAEPIKKGGFPDEFRSFEGKQKYSEWEFRYNLFTPPVGTVGNQNLGGSQSPQP